MAGKRRIGILIFDGAEELDWAGPWEVLAAWSKQWPEDGVDVFTLGLREGPISCAKGLRVMADHIYDSDSAPPMDLVVVPGGRGSRPVSRDESVLAWLRGLHDNGVLVTSVCTGALVLAAARLLRNRPAATWWGAFDELLAIDQTIEPMRDERFVDDGDVITAAGVSAGIDMALHLVARLQSVERARDVRRYIQYDPRPPV